MIDHRKLRNYLKVRNSLYNFHMLPRLNLCNFSFSIKSTLTSSLEQYNPQHPQSPLPYSHRNTSICSFVCEHAGSLLRCLAQVSKPGVLTWAEEHISHLQSMNLQKCFASGQTTQQEDQIKLQCGKV